MNCRRLGCLDKEALYVILSGREPMGGSMAGTEVKLDGEELLIMKESDIMGVLG